MLDGIDLFLCRVGCLVGEWLAWVKDATMAMGAMKILKIPCENGENPSFFHNEMCSSAAVCALAFEGTPIAPI